MRSRPNNRRIEIVLLCLVIAVCLFGLWLCYEGKQLRFAPTVSSHAVDINTPDYRILALALGVPMTTARAIFADREARPGHEFQAVYQFKHCAALQTAEFQPIDQRFIVRTDAQIARGFCAGLALYVLAFLLMHLVVRKLAPNADPFLIPVVALLSGIGLMMVYSIQDPYRDSFVFTGQAWGIAPYGLIALCVPLTRLFWRQPLRRYQYAYAVGAAALMILLLAAGHGPGGIHIRVFGFEPVEIIKVLLIFFVASYLAVHRGARPAPGVGGLSTRDVLPLVAIYLFTLLLFVLVRDLGPAVLLFGAFLAMIYLATNQAAYPLAGAVLLALAGLGAYAMHFGFIATRVVMWRHPWNNPDPHGAQLAQGLWGMATGGLSGSGLGLGNPGLIPRGGSDLIFASIGEELGLAGSLVTLLLYCALIARGFRIAGRAQSEFDRALAAGMTILLGLQAAIIVGGVTGLVPLTGITLPFVSFGASSMVADFFCVGVLLGISHKTQPAAMADHALPEWRQGARHLMLAFGVYLLVFVGLGRLVVLQGIADKATATRLLWTTDADGVIRPHVNPRLTLFAASIPRGRILDRDGAVLARDTAGDEANGCTFLDPEGRARVYAGGASCGQILAAVEADSGPNNPLGRDEALRGYRSYAELLDAYRDRYLPDSSHLHGSDVRLTIDCSLQQAAYGSLFRAAQRSGGGGGGAAVLLDSRTGQVLAAVSSPGYDPAALTSESWTALHSGPDAGSALWDRAFEGLYPPGSAFKIITASAGMTHGLGGQMIDCRHAEKNVVWRFKGHTYARSRITDESGFPPHGETDMAKALRVSCNVYFADMAIALGAPDLLQTATDFGLDHLPPVQKVAEDLPDCGYGQGAMTVTPLEMAQAGQAIADGGVLRPVRVFLSEAPPTGTHRVIPAEDASSLQAMLAAVTGPGGTASGVFDGLPFAVAGKTGSAQNDQGTRKTHSWFVGFAPSPHPTVAFSCVVENGGAGRAAAAPVCRNLVAQALTATPDR